MNIWCPQAEVEQVSASVLFKTLILLGLLTLQRNKKIYNCVFKGFKIKICCADNKWETYVSQRVMLTRIKYSKSFWDSLSANHKFKTRQTFHEKMDSIFLSLHSALLKKKKRILSHPDSASISTYLFVLPQIVHEMQ